MEIVKRGTLPGEREFDVTCRTCQSEIKFRQSEGSVTNSQRDGSFVTIVCPVCGSPIHKDLN